MPTGNARARGFTYVWLLFFIALGTATAAAALGSVQTAMQREREQELLFRGGEFARALARFRDASPEGQPAAPAGLDELLEDRRGRTPAHHLRRLYADPFTGQADWLLLRDADGGIVGVQSRSVAVALRRFDVPGPTADAGRVPRVGEWVFRAAAPASAASGAGSETVE